jgi:dipeptidyl aminopeptidase/acylaminoacyl peptidase
MAGPDLWKERFRAPVILWTARAEGNPEQGVVCTNRTGLFQLYAWDVPSGRLTQITDRPAGLAAGTLSPDGAWVYYLDDRQGNEVGHHCRVPIGGGKPEDITPGLDPYGSWMAAFSGDGTRLGFTAADAAGFHIYVMDVGPGGELGELRLLATRNLLTFGPQLSYGGEVGVLMTAGRGSGPEFSLTAIDAMTGDTIAELWDGEGSSLQMAGLSPVPGDTRLLASTDISGDRRPLLWDPRTGERRDLALEHLDGDVVPADWSQDGRRVLLVQVANAVQRLYTYDLETDEVVALNHPPGVVMTYAPPYFTPEGNIFVHWQDGSHPSCLIEIDGETGEQTRVVLEAGEVPPGRPLRPISFPGARGDSIQGWLAVPEGEGPFPAILYTHGGPESVTLDLYSPEAQMWLDAGFAFLTINYHGSTTFGRAFQQSIWGNPGFLEVEDMAAAREWLIAQGITRPDAVLLAGWSYGGYLTLQALGTTPDLWAGGMAGVAIADWAVQYEDSMEILRAYEVAMFKGTPDERPEQYAKSSPITYVDRVQAPVLVIQGRNDVRCPARPMELYEARMREQGKQIEVRWFETGHVGSAMDVEQGVSDHEAMLAFARRVVGTNP